MKKFFFILFLFITIFAEERFTTKKYTDLNGDGIEEKVEIFISKEEPFKFELKVNDINIKGSFGESDFECDGFMIVDIDTSDKFKEIAVHSPGPSDDDVYIYYHYDGKNLKEIGRISRWPIIKGNGIIYVKDWMGFWEKVEKYVLDNISWTLLRVPQEFYYVGIEGKVKESFPIYQNRSYKEIVANLAKDSKILILACAPQNKDFLERDYLLKSETNLLGWCKERVLLEKVSNLPLAD